jgi:hypothetical protein
MKVSIIIPPNNDEKTIALFLKRITNIIKLLFVSKISNFQTAAISQWVGAYWKTHFDPRMNYLHFVDHLKTSQG